MNPFLNRILTYNEKWIMYDNRRCSGQWLGEDEPPKHFPKPDFHQKKTIITVLVVYGLNHPLKFHSNGPNDYGEIVLCRTRCFSSKVVGIASGTGLSQATYTSP